jgi:hypothetical protein
MRKSGPARGSIRPFACKMGIPAGNRARRQNQEAMLLG